MVELAVSEPSEFIGLIIHSFEMCNLNWKLLLVECGVCVCVCPHVYCRYYDNKKSAFKKEQKTMAASEKVKSSHHT